VQTRLIHDLHRLLFKAWPRLPSNAMRQPVQAFLGNVRIKLRSVMPRGYLKLFFSMLQGRSFAPKHIIDVGANHGEWTRVALKYFPDAYYTLIEPQDHLRAHVADLLMRNSRIRWVGAGASDTCGLCPLRCSLVTTAAALLRHQRQRRPTVCAR